MTLLWTLFLGVVALDKGSPPFVFLLILLCGAAGIGIGLVIGPVLTRIILKHAHTGNDDDDTPEDADGPEREHVD
jgi:hypothetical protein